MDRCYKCGASGSTTPLYSAVTSEGFQKICERCSRQESIPLIRKPTSQQQQTQSLRESVYQRLQGSPASPSMGRAQYKNPLSPTPEDERSLRDMVDQKFDRKLKEAPRQRDDLIQNFHWVIMRARRRRKLTTAQLAEKLREPESAIRAAESGHLPDDYAFINKLELHLGVRIIRPEVVNQIKDITSRSIGFDRESADDMTIADLLALQRRHTVEAQAEDDETTDLSSFSPQQFSSDLPGEDDGPQREFRPSKDRKFGVEEELVAMDDEYLQKINDGRLTQRELDDLVFGRR